jgi:hypothetical protein
MDPVTVEALAATIAASIERDPNPLHLNAMIARLDDLLKGVRPHVPQHALDQGPPSHVRPPLEGVDVPRVEGPATPEGKCD